MINDVMLQCLRFLDPCTVNSLVGYLKKKIMFGTILFKLSVLLS